MGSQKGNDVGRSCGCQGCAFGSCFSLSLLALASWAVQGRGASPSLAALPASSALDQCDWRAVLGAGAGWLPQPSGTEGQVYVVQVLGPVTFLCPGASP